MTHNCFDEELAEAGTAQNKSKTEVLPTFIVQGYVRERRSFCSRPVSKKAGRHLGGIQMYNNSNTAEVNARIRSMWANYHHLDLFLEAF